MGSMGRDWNFSHGLRISRCRYDSGETLAWSVRGMPSISFTDAAVITEPKAKSPGFVCDRRSQNVTSIKITHYFETHIHSPRVGLGL
jgi:hypothetical protein